MNNKLHVKQCDIQGGQKKKRTGDFLQNSQNIGPMSLKINMHNLNTHSFQHLKYEIPNSKASRNNQLSF